MSAVPGVAAAVARHDAVGDVVSVAGGDAPADAAKLPVSVLLVTLTVPSALAMPPPS